MNIAQVLPALVGLLWSLSTQAGGDTPAEPAVRAALAPGASWTKLEYAAKAAAGGVSIRLELIASSPSEFDDAAFTAPDNSTPDFIGAEQVLRLNATAHAQSLLGQSRSQLGIWFEANSGAVLKRHRLRPGRKGNQKVYRFARNGAYRIKREPSGREDAEKSPDHWTKVKQSFYPYDAQGSGCQVVSEPTLLLNFVSRQQPGTADAPESVCVFLDDALYRVRLEPQASEPLDMTYTVNSDAAKQTVSGKQEVVKVLLRVQPLTSGADSADFELLELRGDIAIYVARESGLPLQLSGTRSGAGQVNVRLKKATVAAGANGGAD